MQVKPTTAHTDSIDRPFNKPKPGAADKAPGGDFREMLENAKAEGSAATEAPTASSASTQRPGA